ncbi:MAG: SPASM domain-containing protein, partial [Anaerolineae bacterium]|nr:SPASM domain-containing protein [Anaerolineae bacterium]
SNQLYDLLGIKQAVDYQVHIGLLQPVDAITSLQVADTLTAWLHVTNECNLRCHYCYVAKTPEHMSAETGKQAINAIFRSAKQYNMRSVHLKYAGGEAAINFNRIRALHRQALNLAEEYGIALQATVLSNGVGWSERKIEYLKQQALNLTISLDGIGTDHDIQRPMRNGRGSFAAIERTLNRLATHSVIPNISITISSRNIAGLPQTVDYLLKRNLPFTFNFYRETDLSASHSDLLYQDEQIIVGIKAALSVIEKVLPPYLSLMSLLDLTRLDAPHEHTCGVGNSYMVINHRGGIAKCHMHLDETVTDVTAQNPLQLIRADSIGVQSMSVNEKEGCRDCEWKHWCAGGCPALTYRVMGRYDVKSPNCRIYKAILPELLRLEGLRILKHSPEFVS